MVDDDLLRAGGEEEWEFADHSVPFFIEEAHATPVLIMNAAFSVMILLRSSHNSSPLAVHFLA